MSDLIKKVAQRITVDYCNLSIVENPDGFLSQDVVRALLLQDCGIEVVVGSNLQLRIHYELHYKVSTGRRYVYICKSKDTILADMKRSAHVVDFSISDVFPLFADKALLKKQPFEVLDILHSQIDIRKVSLQECTLLVQAIAKDLADKKRKSADYLAKQLADIELDWNKATTISLVSQVLAKAIKEGVYEGIENKIDEINESFQNWVDKEYFATLQSNALLKAKSVNKILPHIAANREGDEKIALLVVDGFAYWQYVILKEYLGRETINIEDGCTLAWMPSITMLSRQAIFRGAVPQQDYKQSPENEKKLWVDFWRSQGLGSYDVQYISDKDEFAINEGIQCLAVVTVKMDEKMHSSSDYKDLYSLTENWCPRIVEQIITIVNAGYKLYLTSDHGSVLSYGWRTLSQVEKVFLYKDGSRGARHLIYNNKEEQERFFQENQDIRMIKHDNWMSIRDNHCFVNDRTTMLTHGGSHFLEMIVPLIKIGRL
jgi:hypothetical protein